MMALLILIILVMDMNKLAYILKSLYDHFFSNIKIKKLNVSLYLRSKTLERLFRSLVYLTRFPLFLCFYFFALICMCVFLCVAFLLRYISSFCITKSFTFPRSQTNFPSGDAFLPSEQI